MMSLPRIPGLHPREATLHRYADRTLDADALRAVSVHLIGCRRCRALADGIQRLRDAVRAEPVPVAPQAMFERVLARRAAGERVILPAGDVPHASTNPRWRVFAAAAVVIAVGGVALFSSRSATAAGEEGELFFTPAHPRAGMTVEAEYRATDRFASDSLLMLRARFRSIPEGVPSEAERTRPTVARFAMRRSPDGKFRARFVFPVSAVHATFAIEDSAGSRLDTRRGQLWELSAHDSGGHATFNALLAAADGGAGRGWDARYAAARALVAAFPDSIIGWRTLTFAESVVKGTSDSAAMARYRSAFDGFDAAARRNEGPTPTLLGNLLWFARSLHDTTRELYWKERLMRAAPNDPLAAQERAVRAIERRRPDSNALALALPALDRIWQETQGAGPTITTFGLQSAMAAKDARAIARWGQRYLEMTHNEPGSVQWVARELVKYPTTRSDGLRVLRGLLVPIDVSNDSRRGLKQSVGARQHEIDELRAWTLQHIGEGLLAEGKHLAALDSLRLASRVGWNLERFRDIAAADLSAGDTTDARQMLAFVALDPTTPPVFTDSARTMLGASVTDVMWRATVQASEKSMYERVLATSTRKPLRGDRVRLLTSAGEPRTFAALADGHVTVVAFGVELRRPRSPVDADQMQHLSRRLTAQGARLVAIGLGARGPDMPALVRKRGLSFEVYFDEYRDADRAFGAFGFPIYFVVDASGTIRFAYSEPKQLLVQATALGRERQIAGARP